LDAIATTTGTIRMKFKVMSNYWYCLASKAIAVSGFVALAVNGSPWWGLCCFYVVASIDGKLEAK